MIQRSNVYQSPCSLQCLWFNFPIWPLEEMASLDIHSHRIVRFKMQVLLVGWPVSCYNHCLPFSENNKKKTSLMWHRVKLSLHKTYVFSFRGVIQMALRARIFREKNNNNNSKISSEHFGHPFCCLNFTLPHSSLYSGVKH